MSNVSAIDSRIFRNLFGTSEIRNVFSDTSYIQHCLTVEAALARAQATCGIIPSSAASTISSTSTSTTFLDFDKLGAETEIVGYPILPLIRQLSTACGDDDAGRFVHWGATTQDIQDTASVLQIREGLEIVERKIDEVITALEGLAREYKGTPMAGRTHLQHALPVTFGYKAAVWLSSFYRHRDRLAQLKPRVLMVQYGGAAGTLASLGPGEAGLRVRAELAKELGLANPNITWHVARDGIAEVVNFLALLGGSMGKVAMDVMLMASNEVGEVQEPFVPHRGASSTMPQKRNPISAEVMLAGSKILRSHAGLVLDAVVADFERATGPWHLEWVAVPESFVVAVGVLCQADFVLKGLVVDEKRMLENLRSSRGLIVGEAVMMGLAPEMGRQKAHDEVYEACKDAIEEKTSLLEALKKREEIVRVVGLEELQKLCDPVNYLGACVQMVEKTLASGSSA